MNGAALILRRASLDAWDEATATPRVSDHSVWTTLESAAGTIVKATDSLDAQIPCSDAATLETPNAGLEDVYVGIRLALDSVGVTVDLHMPPSPTGHADATGAQGFERLLAGTPPPAWEARAPQSQNGAPSPEAGFEAGTPLERATGARLSAVPAPGPFAVPAASLVLGILLGLAAMLPVLALYHRIRRQQALSPAKRRRIYDLVEADPGVTPAELQAATGLHYTTCVHHLRILRDLGIVESIRIGRHLHYFVAGAGYGAVEKRVRASMRSPTPGRLLALLAHRPGTSIANAARSLCVRAPSLRHHTDRLTRAGLLEIRKEGGRTRLCLAPAAVDHTLRLLPR